MKEEKMPLIMKHIIWFSLAWQWRYPTDKTGFLFIGTHCTSLLYYSHVLTPNSQIFYESNLFLSPNGFNLGRVDCITLLAFYQYYLLSCRDVPPQLCHSLRRPARQLQLVRVVNSACDTPQTPARCSARFALHGTTGKTKRGRMYTYTRLWKWCCSCYKVWACGTC